MGKHFMEVEASLCIYGVMGGGLNYGFPLLSLPQDQMILLRLVRHVGLLSFTSVIRIGF